MQKFISGEESCLVFRNRFFIHQRKFLVFRLMNKSAIFFDKRLSLSQVIIAAILVCDDSEKAELDTYLKGSGIE